MFTPTHAEGHLGRQRLEAINGHAPERWARAGGQACHRASGWPVVGTCPGVDSPLATVGMPLAPLQS